MGIDASAVLIWGVRASEIEYGEYDGLYEYVEDRDLDRASPWFDSGIHESVIGICVARSYDYSADVITQDLLSAIEKAKKEFLELTGLEGRLYISPHIT